MGFTRRQQKATHDDAHESGGGREGEERKFGQLTSIKTFASHSPKRIHIEPTIFLTLRRSQRAHNAETSGGRLRPPPRGAIAKSGGFAIDVCVQKSPFAIDRWRAGQTSEMTALYAQHSSLFSWGISESEICFRRVIAGPVNLAAV